MPAPDTSIADAVAALGTGPLTEPALVRHVHPLFSRVLARREIYLSNHSLGRPLDRTARDIAGALDPWYSDMDDAWPAWMAAINDFRAGIARLIGLSRPDAVVPRPGAGQGLRAVLNALPMPSSDRGGRPAGSPAGRPLRILTTRGEFDSIDFILRAYADRGRADVLRVEPRGDGDFHAEDLIARLDDTVDLVVVSLVFYATGQVLPGIERLVTRARELGVPVLVDAYHAAGVIPVEFDRLGADFMIGGSYKYTRGGPGAGWLAVHPRHLTDPGSHGPPPLFTLDTGWFAKRGHFDFMRRDEPFPAMLAPGGDAWLECTPVVLTAYQARAGLELALGIGVERLRAYSLEQQAFLAAELHRRGVPVRRWSEPERTAGAFLRIPHADAPALVRRLKAAGVSADARLGHVRLCPDILNTRDELERAAHIVARALVEPGPGA